MARMHDVILFTVFFLDGIPYILLTAIFFLTPAKTFVMISQKINNQGVCLQLLPQFEHGDAHTPGDLSAQLHPRPLLRTTYFLVNWCQLVAFSLVIQTIPGRVWVCGKW